MTVDRVKFLAGRLGSMIVVLLVLAFIVFLLQRYTPADPVRVKLGANASPELVEAERERLGYNDPLPVQYVNYIKGVLTGDLQDSLRTRNPVTTDLSQAVPATLELTLVAVVIAAILAVSLGLASAARMRGSGVLRVVMIAGASAPVFLLALLGLLFFYRRLQWLPATGRTSISDAPEGPTKLLLVDSLMKGRFDVFTDSFKHLLMPAFCIALGPAVAIGRTLRGSILDTMSSDYVRTARAKGLKERTVLF
ncbi:MAG TPA: ABC transporter permease, partial [Acidimicrobiia bacterium]|nr:ABC transporter permease [Acidimicrobiia bacterium]